MEGELKGFNFLHALILAITIAKLGFFIVFLSLNLAYFKTLAVTIKTILKAAFESNSPFLAYQDDVKAIKHTKLREEVENQMRIAEKDQDLLVRWTVILDNCKKKSLQNEYEN
jgi:hypothetical protein